LTSEEAVAGNDGALIVQCQIGGDIGMDGHCEGLDIAAGIRNDGPGRGGMRPRGTGISERAHHSVSKVHHDQNAALGLANTLHVKGIEAQQRLHCTGIAQEAQRESCHHQGKTTDTGRRGQCRPDSEETTKGKGITQHVISP